MHVTTDARQADAVARDVRRLQGRWRQTYHEADGVAEPGEDYGSGLQTQFIGDRFVVTGADGRVVLEGTFTLDPTRMPKAIDWTDTIGADAGKTLAAIYTLQDDRLVFCAADAGDPRPTEMKTRPGRTLRVHQRVAPTVSTSIETCTDAQ